MTRPRLAVLVGLLTLGYTLSASAGAISDTDGDLVPDQFDNCRLVANGPNQTSNQVDTNLDGFGNACDADLDDNNSCGGTDFSLFVGFFGKSTAAAKAADFDGDNLVGGSDFAIFVQRFGTPPGPSGLACAGTIPCTP